jgi:hypothetical protein
MRKISILAMLLLTAGSAGLSAQQASWRPLMPARPDIQPVSYGTLTASDGSFAVRLPANWQVRSASVTNTMAQSARGESVAWGVVSVIDVPHFQMYQRSLGQFGRYANQVFPVVANPMPPEGIILYLYPRFYADARNIRILGERPEGPSSALIFYEYAPPASRTPIRGGALIITTPPQPGNLGMWTIAYWKAEAPSSLFNQDLPMFSNILSSLNYNADRILAMVGQNQASMHKTIGSMIDGEQHEYQRSSQMIAANGQQMLAMQTQLGQTFQHQDLINGQNGIATLGGYAPFQDANGAPLMGPLDSRSVNTSTLGPPRFSPQDSSSLGPGWRPITQVY